VRLRDALSAERELCPAWPDRIEAMRAWLTRHAEPLIAAKLGVENTLRDLEQRALPLSDEMREADRREHPRYGELRGKRAKLAALRRAHAISSGKASLEVSPLGADLAAQTASELDAFAWPRVTPDDAERIWGEEALALTAAQAAVGKLNGGDGSIPGYHVLHVLAWAWLWNGKPDQAAFACRMGRAQVRASCCPMEAGRARPCEALLT